MKKVYNFIIFQIFTFVAAWIIFVLLISTPFFDFIEIYFYRSIVILIFTCIITFIMELTIKLVSKKSIYDYKDIILSITLIGCINMVWLSSAVVSLDRSLSVFLLSYMAKEERYYSEQEIEEIFQETFVKKYGMLDRRFWEQIETGNIKKIPGGG